MLTSWRRSHLPLLVLAVGFVGCRDSPGLRDPLDAGIRQGEIFLRSCDKGDLLVSVVIERPGDESWSAKAETGGVSLLEPVGLRSLSAASGYEVSGELPVELAVGDVVTIRTSQGNYLGFQIGDPPLQGVDEMDC